jgi:hypothetical protein
LRDITGLCTFHKIAEKVIGELSIEDMKAKLDPSKFAKKKRHRSPALLNMLNIILVALNKSSNGEVKAVIATHVDWNQAFPRQC